MAIEGEAPMRRGNGVSYVEDGAGMSSATETAPPIRTLRWSRLPVYGLVVLTLVLYGRGFTHSRGASGDSFHHLINGIFVYDAARSPADALADPMGFATRYYSHYPAVSLGYYPPGFAMIEASLMALFGVSAATGQLAVLLLSLLMALMAYAWLRLRFDPWWAAGTAAVLVSTPLLVDWGRGIMLEVPLVAFVIGAMWGFERALRSDRPSWSAVLTTAVCTTLAVWTKQHALLLLGIFAVSILASRRWRLLFMPRMLAGVLWIAAAAGGVIAMTLMVGGDAVGHTTGFTAQHAVDRINLAQWTFYLKRIPSILGWPMLLTAGLGFVWVCCRKETHVTPLLAWIVLFYLMHSYFKAQHIRYASLWIPPFCVLAAIGLKHLPFSLPLPKGLSSSRRRVSAGAVVLTLWVVVAVVGGYPRPIRAVPSVYQRATDDLCDRQGPFTCLTYFPDRPGRIAVCLRLAVEERRSRRRDIYSFGRILRAMHVVRAWRARYRDISHLNTSLMNWNVKYILTELPRPRDYFARINELAAAVDGLIDPDRGYFRLVRSYPVKLTDGRSPTERTLALYERIEPMEYDPEAAAPLHTARVGIKVPARRGKTSP